MLSAENPCRHIFHSGREYSILHSTLADLFEQIDPSTRRTLNELEYVLNELTNVKLFYSSKEQGTQIHLHHHHHHVYHHSTTSSEPCAQHYHENRFSPYSSQISLALTGTATTNGSSQGYHSISASPTITMENLNKENVRTPLSFKNPLFHNPSRDQQDDEHLQSDLSDDEDHRSTKVDPAKALYFVNSLCVESLKRSSLLSSPSSSQRSLVHSASRQSLQQQPQQQQPQQQQQPLFVLNNGYLTRSTQSLASSNATPPITSKNSATPTYYCLRTNDDLIGSTRRHMSLSSQPAPPKMGVKALNHNSSTKVSIDSSSPTQSASHAYQSFAIRAKTSFDFIQDLVVCQRSPMLNLYQEEKCRRMESEKQAERFVRRRH